MHVVQVVVQVGNYKIVLLPLSKLAVQLSCSFPIVVLVQISQLAYRAVEELQCVFPKEQLSISAHHIAS